MKYLSRQQRKVLIWCARGKTNKEIAALLYVSARTIDEHCRDICKRLNAANIKQAVHIATRLRLI